MNDALSAFLQLIDAPQSATRDARLPDAARALLATLADPVEGQGVDRRRALVRLAEVSAELRPRDRRRLVSATRATFAETASALKDGPRSLYLAYVILVTMALAPSGLVPATGEALAELEGERVDLPGTLGELLPEDDPDRRPVGGLQDLEQDLGRMLAALQGGRLEEALELQPKLLVRFEDAKGRGAEAAAAVLRGAFERGARQVESGAGLRDLAEAFGPLLVEGDLPHHPLAKLLVAAAPLPKSPASPGVPDTPLFLDRLLERMEEKDERLSPLLRRAEIAFPLLQRIEARAAAQTQVTSWADRADMWVERYTNRLSQLDRRLGILDALFGSGRDPFERLRLGRFADFDGFESFGAGAQRLGFVLPITMPDGSTGMGFEGFGLDLPNFSFPGMPGMPGGMPAFPGMIQGAGSFGGAFPNLAGMNLPPALKAMISSGQLPASALQQLRSGRLASLFGGSGGASRGLRGLQTLLRGSGAMRHLALGLAGGGMSAGSFPGFSGFSLPQLRQASLGSMPGGMSFASLARSGGGGLPPWALPASLRSLSGGGGRSFAGLGGLDLSRFPGFAGLSSGSMPRFSGGFSGGGFGGAGFARSLSGGFGGLSLGSLPQGGFRMDGFGRPRLTGMSGGVSGLGGFGASVFGRDLRMPSLGRLPMFPGGGIRWQASWAGKLPQLSQLGGSGSFPGLPSGFSGALSQGGFGFGGASLGRSGSHGGGFNMGALLPALSLGSLGGLRGVGSLSDLRRLMGGSSGGFSFPSSGFSFPGGGFRMPGSSGASSFPAGSGFRLPSMGGGFSSPAGGAFRLPGLSMGGGFSFPGGGGFRLPAMGSAGRLAAGMPGLSGFGNWQLPRFGGAAFSGARPQLPSSAGWQLPNFRLGSGRPQAGFRFDPSQLGALGGFSFPSLSGGRAFSGASPRMPSFTRWQLPGLGGSRGSFPDGSFPGGSFNAGNLGALAGLFGGGRSFAGASPRMPSFGRWQLPSFGGGFTAGLSPRAFQGAGRSWSLPSFGSGKAFSGASPRMPGFGQWQLPRFGGAGRSLGGFSPRSFAGGLPRGWSLPDFGRFGGGASPRAFGGAAPRGLGARGLQGFSFPSFGSGRAFGGAAASLPGFSRWQLPNFRGGAGLGSLGGRYAVGGQARMPGFAKWSFPGGRSFAGSFPGMTALSGGFSRPQGGAAPRLAQGQAFKGLDFKGLDFKGLGSGGGRGFGSLAGFAGFDLARLFQGYGGGSSRASSSSASFRPGSFTFPGLGRAPSGFGPFGRPGSSHGFQLPSSPSMGGFGGFGAGGFGAGGFRMPSMGGSFSPAALGGFGMPGMRGFSMPGFRGFSMPGMGGSFSPASLGGSRMPSMGGMSGFRMPSMGGFSLPGFRMPSMGGYSLPGLRMPGMGGFSMPSMGGFSMPGFRMPSMGGMGLSMPSMSGSAPNSFSLPSMGGFRMPSMGGMSGFAMPGMGTASGFRMPSMSGFSLPAMGGFSMPSGMGGFGMPSMGGMGSFRMPSMGGFMPRMGGMSGFSMPSMGGFSMPSMGGMSGFSMPSMGGMSGFSMPSMGGMSGLSMAGSGSSMPSLGGVGGFSMPSMGGFGLPSGLGAFPRLAGLGGFGGFGGAGFRMGSLGSLALGSPAGGDFPSLGGFDSSALEGSFSSSSYPGLSFALPSFSGELGGLSGFGRSGLSASPTQAASTSAGSFSWPGGGFPGFASFGFPSFAGPSPAGGAAAGGLGAFPLSGPLARTPSSMGRTIGDLLASSGPSEGASPFAGSLASAASSSEPRAGYEGLGSSLTLPARASSGIAGGGFAAGSFGGEGFDARLSSGTSASQRSGSFIGPAPAALRRAGMNWIGGGAGRAAGFSGGPLAPDRTPGQLTGGAHMAFAAGGTPASSLGGSASALSGLVGPRGLSLPGSLWARGGSLAPGSSFAPGAAGANAPSAAFAGGSFAPGGSYALGAGAARMSPAQALVARSQAGAAAGAAQASLSGAGAPMGSRPRFSLSGGQSGGYRSPSVTLAGAAGRPQPGSSYPLASAGAASSGSDLSRHLFGFSSLPQGSALSLGSFDALGAARGHAGGVPARGWRGLAAYELGRPATGLSRGLLAGGAAGAAGGSILDLAHGADRSPRIVPGLGSGSGSLSQGRPSLTLLRGGASAPAGSLFGGSGPRWQSLAAGQLQGQQPVFDYGVGGGSSASAPRSSLVRFLQSSQPGSGGPGAPMGGGPIGGGLGSQTTSRSGALSPRAERTLVRVLSRGGAPGSSAGGGSSDWRGPTAGAGATISTGRRGSPIPGWPSGSAPRSLGLTRSAPGGAGRASDRLAAQVYNRASGAGSTSGGAFAPPTGSYALPGAGHPGAPRSSAGQVAGARPPAGAPGALPRGPQGWGARGSQPASGWDGSGPALVAPSSPARMPGPVAGPAARGPRPASFPEMEHTNLVAGPGSLAAAGAPSGASEPPARPQEVLYSRAANVDPGGTDSGGQAPSQSSELESASLSTAPQDLSLLVNQLYAQIKRELTIERERRGLMS